MGVCLFSNEYSEVSSEIFLHSEIVIFVLNT